jgi:TonB-dependent receptor
LSGFEQQISLIDNPDGSQVSGPTRFVEIDQSRSYSDVLPSLNLRMPLTRTAQIRLAASSNISRPTFAQSNPGILLVEPGRAQQDQLHEIGEGNPALRPMTSRNLDATVEWYFARTGSLSAAVFYKSISNYIQTEISTPTITFDNGHSYEFNVTTYRNAGNATIKGAEISYQEFFDFLPGALSGLGLQANFTYVDSQVPAPATTGPVSNVPAELLSKFSYNVIGIYEKGPISGRVAYNWRSRYIETTLGNQSGNLPVFNKPFGQLDASLTYHVNPRLSLTIDGVNLTDTRRSTYFGIATRPRDLTVNDRRFSAVVRLNL